MRAADLTRHPRPAATLHPKSASSHFHDRRFVARLLWEVWSNTSHGRCFSQGHAHGSPHSTADGKTSPRHSYNTKGAHKKVEEKLLDARRNHPPPLAHASRYDSDRCVGVCKKSRDATMMRDDACLSRVLPSRADRAMGILRRQEHLRETPLAHHTPRGALHVVGLGTVLAAPHATPAEPRDATPRCDR